MKCSDSKFSEINHFFNQPDRSLSHHVIKCRVTQKLRKSNVVYHKIKNPFGAKIFNNYPAKSRDIPRD